jgi:PAS domain S-box-containing protein
MGTQVVLIVSTASLIAAAVLALRLRQFSRSRWAWIPFVALLLFALRPLLVLVGLQTGAVSELPSPVTELVGLIASVLVLVAVGVAMRSLRRWREIPQITHDDLDRRVQARTTELLAANEALRGGEERMRLIVENLPVMVAAWDEANLLIWNRECERITGYSAGEMVRNPRAFELLFPDPANREQFTAALRRGPRLFRDRQLILTTKAGVQRVIAWSDVSQQYPVPGWQGWAIGIDMTERRQAEEALRRAQELLERRIAERTTALRTANEALQGEIAERRAAEAAEREQRALSEALRDTATALNSTLELDEVLRRLLVNVEQVVPHDAANVMLVGEGIARVVLARGYAPHVPEEQVLAISFDVDRTPHMRRVIETGHVQVLSDVTADPDWITLPETQWIRSYAIAPIRLEGEVIGFINLDSATPGAFTPEHGERLQAFAEQAAVAIRNARLYEQARQDLTERQRAEEALRHSEEQLRTTLDALDDIVYVVDRDLRLTLMNDSFRRWNLELGLAANPIGITPFELFPFLPEHARDEYRRVFETGEAVTTEESTRVGTMTLFTETRKVPVFVADQVFWVVTVIRDVTEQKRAAEALRESEERYRMVSELVSDYAYSFRIEPDGTPVLEWMTEAFQRIAGYMPAELLALGGWQVLWHPDDVALTQRRIRNLLAGQVEMTEYRIVTRSGEVRWLRDYAQPIWDETEGRVVRFIGAAKDITDRKQAEQQVLRLRLEQERGAILTNFIRDVSHEFANPLSVIKNDLYLIARTEDPEKWRQRLEDISAQIFHIERLVEGLMTMSRLDAGAGLLLEPLDVNRLVQMVLDGQTSVFQQQGHALVTDLSPDLPRIEADQRYLYQALTKLVENAIQYTPSGGTIRLRTATSGPSVIIEVSDTGVGIDPEDLEHIFDRFFRVDTARVQRGAGLGLSIARKVVELHGGRLEVESAPGVGSTFRVFLPISNG